MLIFLDESGFNTTPHIVTTWAPKGETPIFQHPFTWHKLSVISAVTTKGKLYFRIHKKASVSKSDIINFIRQILYQTSENIILYLDGLPQHKSKQVQSFIENHERLEGRRFPSYSPDLNPDEGVWSYIKTKMLPNLVIKKCTELDMKVKSALHKLQRKTNLILQISFSQLKKCLLSLPTLIHIVSSLPVLLRLSAFNLNSIN